MCNSLQAKYELGFETTIKTIKFVAIIITTNKRLVKYY